MIELPPKTQVEQRRPVPARLPQIPKALLGFSRLLCDSRFPFAFSNFLLSFCHLKNLRISVQDAIIIVCTFTLSATVLVTHHWSRLAALYTGRTGAFSRLTMSLFYMFYLDEMVDQTDR